MSKFGGGRVSTWASMEFTTTFLWDYNCGFNTSKEKRHVNSGRLFLGDTAEYCQNVSY